ncbi:MAG: polysaccharide deacetylase family protein [Terriglobia bacterium]
MAVSSIAKRWAKKVLLVTGAARRAALSAPPSAALLAYHSVQDHPQAGADTIGVKNIHSTAVFTRQMELLARAFYPVTLEDVLLFADGQKRLPPRSVAVTFDDGYLDNYEIVAPVLDRFGIRGTFYVIVDSLDGGNLPWFIRLRRAFWTTQLKIWREPANGIAFSLEKENGRRTAFLAACGNCARLVGSAQEEFVRSIETGLESLPPAPDGIMMQWDHVRRLHAAGHTVGSHTLCHPNMAFISEGDARREFTESKRRLEEELGAEVRHFSYPHPALDPNCTPQTAAISREIGFTSGVTTVNGPVREGQNAWLLPRLYTLSHLDDFRWHLERAFFAPGEGQAHSYEA